MGLKSGEKRIIEGNVAVCNHLKKFWDHFFKEVIFFYNALVNNVHYDDEEDYLDHVVLHLKKGDDKDLRALARKEGLDYEKILLIYVKAVFYLGKRAKKQGEKWQCRKE